MILEALPSIVARVADASAAHAEAPAHADPARHEPNDDEIRLRAYEIYQARGGTEGHALDDWLQAERELRGRTAV